MDIPNLVPLPCPTCGTEFDVGHLPKGTRTFCPKCRTIVTCPGEAPVPPAAPPAVQPASPVTSPSPEAAAALHRVSEPAAPVAAPQALSPATPKAEPPQAPAPRPASPKMARPPTRRVAPTAPKQGSGLGIAALVLGLLGFLVPLLGLLGAGLGLAALRKARGLALGGILSGVLSLALHGTLFFAVLLPNWQRSLCQARVARIHSALDAYRLQTGQEATTLSALVSAKFLGPADIDCPARSGSGKLGYVLLDAAAVTSSGLRMAEREDYHGAGRRLVLTAGGAIEFRPSSVIAALPGMEAPQKELPGPGPRIPEKMALLDVHAQSWKGTPLDVAGALVRALQAEGIGTASGGRDGVIDLEYAERRGPLYTNGSRSTVAEMTLTVFSADRRERLLRLEARGVTPALLCRESGIAEEDLHRAALEEFQRSAALVHAGPLIAAALGSGKALPKVAEALLWRDTREVALDLLDRHHYRPTEKRPAAAFAAAREEFEECRKLGKEGAEVLAEAFRHFDDFDRVAMARMLGEMREPCGGRALEDFLRSEDPDLRVQIASIEALGKIGDVAALPLLDALAGSDPPEMAKAAREAILSIRHRSP